MTTTTETVARRAPGRAWGEMTAQQRREATERPRAIAQVRRDIGRDLLDAAVASIEAVGGEVRWPWEEY